MIRNDTFIYGRGEWSRKIVRFQFINDSVITFLFHLGRFFSSVLFGGSPLPVVLRQVIYKKFTRITSEVSAQRGIYLVLAANVDIHSSIGLYRKKLLPVLLHQNIRAR